MKNMTPIPNCEFVVNIADDIEYKDWMYSIYPTKGMFNSTAVLFYICFYAQDTYTGKRELQTCRTWLIEKDMTEFEIVDTIFKAIKAAEEHEVKETFKYKGKRLYNPHRNLLKTVGLEKK